MSIWEQIPQQKILTLKVNNFAGVNQIEIALSDENLIAGENWQGKTSLLNALDYLLSGPNVLKREAISRMLHGDAKGGEIAALTEDLVIERKIKKKETGEQVSTLVVKTRDGVPYPRPQQMLDAIVSMLPDPMAIYKMSTDEKYNMLLHVIGKKEEMEQLDRTYQETYEFRRSVNRQFEQQNKTLAGLEMPELNTPNEELDIKELNEKYLQMEAVNSEIKHKQKSHEFLIRDITMRKERIAKQQEELKKVQAQLKATEKYLNENPLLDTEEIKEKIGQVDEINRKVRHRDVYAATENKAGELKVHSEQLTQQLEDIKEKKKALLAGIEKYAKDITVEDGVILHKGIPIEQCSSAEQILIAVKLAIALNKDKKIKLFLIRGGAFLTDETYSTLLNLVKKYDYQLLFEKPGTPSKECIIIDNGLLKGGQNAKN